MIGANRGDATFVFSAAHRRNLFETKAAAEESKRDHGCKQQVSSKPVNSGEFKVDNCFPALPGEKRVSNLTSKSEGKRTHHSSERCIIRSINRKRNLWLFICDNTPESHESRKKVKAFVSAAGY
ncbi:hypothetical protein AVEN_263460-1 [Araneus ventricosus]|uniref:Uncharacterized protein n=1 Tax=Araneus ventricosus TaxID=182803 RepID=A0A4Y2I4L6_ARAVE|nr:hypothetical protein AVEN_263460-1 [Araneus ventricosus]